MYYTACPSDRALYRRDAHRASQGGGRALKRFLEKAEYLFAPEEARRVNQQAAVLGWDKIAYHVEQKFRAYRGVPHDPASKPGGSAPSIVETIITPYRFMAHAMFGSRL